MRVVVFLIGLVGFTIAASVFLLQRKSQTIDLPISSRDLIVEPSPTVSSVTTSSFIVPVEGFLGRINKKPFGIYITKDNSPVSPERFAGYHTGVDVEYGDVEIDVPVFAVVDGVVVTAKTASGYGGVMVVKGQIDGRALYFVYGHVRPSSLVAVGTTVTKGQQLAVLGTGYSQETDVERRHLHFGIAKTNSILGYVDSQEKLNEGWIDPLELWR